MECPKCGYAMEPLDKECARCKRNERCLEDHSGALGAPQCRQLPCQSVEQGTAAGDSLAPSVARAPSVVLRWLLIVVVVAGVCYVLWSWATAGSRAGKALSKSIADGTIDDDKAVAAMREKLRPMMDEASTQRETDERAWLEQQTWEYKLATLNAGAPVAENDPTVAEFRAYLDRIQSACRNTREEICDMAVKAQQILLGRGINLSLLEVTKGLALSLPEGVTGANLEFAEIAAAYTTLTTQFSQQ